jgi:hypothetical protein
MIHAINADGHERKDSGFSFGQPHTAGAQRFQTPVVPDPAVSCCSCFGKDTTGGLQMPQGRQGLNRMNSSTPRRSVLSWYQRVLKQGTKRVLVTHDLARTSVHMGVSHQF